MATLKDQLHKSGSHATGFDPACPGCCADLDAVIAHLERCASCNEEEAKRDGAWGRDAAAAANDAVAVEQRRMIRILKQHQKARAWK